MIGWGRPPFKKFLFRQFYLVLTISAIFPSPLIRFSNFMLPSSPLWHCRILLSTLSARTRYVFLSQSSKIIATSPFKQTRIEPMDWLHNLRPPAQSENLMFIHPWNQAFVYGFKRPALVWFQ